MFRGPRIRRYRLTSWRALVVLGLVATGLGWLGMDALQRQIGTRAVHSAELSARLIGSLVVQRNITVDDLRLNRITAAAWADMDGDVAQLVRERQLAGLEVWSTTGQLLYADPGHPAAERQLPSSEAAQVRRGTATHISRTGRSGPTLDVLLPYDPDADGNAEAIIEVLLPHDPVNDTITRSTQLVRAGAGTVALLAALLVWSTWRRHRRQEYRDRHDELTGLGNRTLLALRGAGAVDGSGRTALLLLDLDGFKEINDTLGHQAGDELLVEVATRLREVCGSGETVVRLGGDEFAVLLPDLPDPDTAEARARRLRRALREPVTVAGLSVEVDASVGIAVAPDHGTDINTLLRCADVAMYDAKRTGSGVTSYDPRTDTRDERHLTVLAELRHAIGSGQLRLYYQPKSRPDGSVDRVEALIRWEHPERGLLAPYQFLPLAERTPLIRPLTAWVIREAARQCAAWRESGLALDVAVNISPRNLADPELPTTVLDAVAAAGLSPGALEIEITETAVTADPERARMILNRLRAMGLRVSIDDFGSGYTSLSQLAELPVHALKIDRMFVADLHTDAAREAVVRNVIQLARDLGLSTVAEGVESIDVWARLNALGCDEIQGYVLTPPLPADRFVAWLTDWRRVEASPRG